MPSNASQSPSTPPNNQSPQAQGLRSRLGCWNCREKKVKCDEQRPTCDRCIRLNRVCDYRERPRKPYIRQKRTTASVTGVAHNNGESTIPTSRPTPHSPISVSQDAHLERDDLLPNEAGNAVDPSNCDLSPQLLCYSEASLTSACANIILSPSDNAAIHHFRATISIEVDTKVVEHSGPAIIWALAQRSPLVLHMVCAFGGQRRSYEESLPAEEAQACRSQAMEHYGAALTLLTAATRQTMQSSEFDDILAALWLIISYKQRFGDGCGVGLIAHFQGAAALLRERLQSIRDIMNADQSNSVPGSSFLSSDPQQNFGSLSPLGCRIICWIAMSDGGAAFHGLGGEFNSFLGNIAVEDDEHAISSRLRTFVALYRHSNLLYRDIWGASYPQDQILEDLESAALLNMQAETGQLRYMLSQLPKIDDACRIGPRSPFVQMERAIQDVRNRYSEYLEAACLLELPQHEHRQRFVMNTRCIVPFFLAVVLCFNRITNTSSLLNIEQRAALRDIMNLAFKTLNDEGEVSMVRLAWPLFVVALESDDMMHQSWILERYNCLQCRGENYRRARETLRIAFTEQKLGERRIDGAELLRREGTDRFVI